VGHPFLFSRTVGGKLRARGAAGGGFEDGEGGALRIGNDYELLGLTSEARKWYERSLAIDPRLPQIREALSRVEGQN